VRKIPVIAASFYAWQASLIVFKQDTAIPETHENNCKCHYIIQ